MRPVRSATLSAIAIATLFGALGAGAGAGCIDAGGGPPDDPGEPTGPVDPGGPVKPDPTDAGTSPEQPGEPTVPPDLSTGCPVQGTSTMMSLAVTDAAVLARFSFARTVAQLRATAAVPGSQTTRMLWRDWMRSFGASSAPGDCDDVDVNHYGLRCPRPAEAKLANIDPLAAGAAVRFVPVGLFNRFDLAPATGSNCGEFRIVYAMQSQDPTITGRAFLIFEGALPNPTPAAGLAACLPVARFWQALSADGDPASRAAKLERFFYLGTAVPGFGAVVRASNYGLANGATALHGAGQIRGNFFVDNAEWHLREYRLRRTCDVASDPSTCKLAAELVPAKANPADELFRGTHPLSASFQAAFVAQVPRLVGTSVTSLGMTFADGFDELESVSQTTPAPAPVRYDVNASAAIRAAVTARLGQLGSSLTSSQVLARATTQTCAGCHQVANNLGLGGGLRWPTSLQFVHIDENRRLSPALTGTFLPHRLQVLEGFINARCTAPGQTARQAVAAVADGFTVGGSPIGAAN